MNEWAILFFALIIAVLAGYIFLERRDPKAADVVAGRADSLWKRLRAKWK